MTLPPVLEELDEMPETVPLDGFADTVLGWTTADAEDADVTLSVGILPDGAEPIGGGTLPTALPPEPGPPP